MMHWIDLARPREIGSLADRVRRGSGQYKLALGGGSQKQRPRLEVSGIIKHYIIQNFVQQKIFNFSSHGVQSGVGFPGVLLRHVSGHRLGGPDLCHVIRRKRRVLTQKYTKNHFPR